MTECAVYLTKTKKDFRRKIRKTLGQLEQNKLIKKSQKLSRRLNDSMQEKQTLIWGVFSPLKTEPKWQMEIVNLSAFKLAYPRFKSQGQMEFIQCREDELVASKEFGVELPCPPKQNPRVYPQALLVPALGLTHRGERIGNGGGYYDRVLREFQGLRIGICFDEQLYYHLPMKDHDQRVQVVVTDKRIIRCEA